MRIVMDSDIESAVSHFQTFGTFYINQLEMTGSVDTCLSNLKVLSFSLNS